MKKQKLEPQQNSDSNADNSQVSPLAQSRMLSAALSVEEQKWYDRAKAKILSSEYGYYCSWWLRLDYDEENLTTSKINYWLTKLVKKGLLTKKTAKSHTQYFLTDVVIR